MLAMLLGIVWKISANGQLSLVTRGLAVLAAVCSWSADHIRKVQNRKNSVTSIPATVFSYRTETRGKYGQHKKYFLKFVTKQDKKRLEFEVSYADYENYQVGDNGILSYRTWEYISFQRTNH